MDPIPAKIRIQATPTPTPLVEVPVPEPDPAKTGFVAPLVTISKSSALILPIHVRDMIPEGLVQEVEHGDVE